MTTTDQEFRGAIAARLAAIADLMNEQWEVIEDEDVEAWEIVTERRGPICMPICEINQGADLAEFIAHAPGDVAWLLDTLTDVLAENAMLRVGACGVPRRPTNEDSRD